MSDDKKKYAYRASLGAHDSRLKARSAQTVVDYCYAPRFKGSMPTFEPMIQYNLAHVLELQRSSVISPADAAELVRALRWIRGEGAESFELDPRLESLMPNIEAILVDRIGADVGGQVLTGRSRGEVEAVAGLLLVRRVLLDLLQEVADLREVIIGVARGHLDTVMPGYTHLQHAQPTTLGHYLACVAEALETDCARLDDAYRRANMSPAETGTSWGSGYAIDRQRIAEALGFKGIIENTRYAYYSIMDKGIEVLAGLCGLAVTLNRFTEDIYFWCTPEYAMAELADEYAGTSYIMPQKKNVTVLQRYSTLVSTTASRFNKLTFQAARTSFGIASNLAVTMMDCAPEVSAALEDNLGAVTLLRGLVSTMSFREDTMKERAGVHFTQSTELADTLFRDKGVSFRTAHRIVGSAVRRALAQGSQASDIDAETLNAAAVEVTGKPIDPPYDSLWKALDPQGVVSAHDGLGAVAPQAVSGALGRRNIRLDEDVARLEHERARLTAAADALERVADAVAQASPP